MDHSELVKRAYKWLRNTAGCGFAFTELCAYTNSGEIPDAIGWRGGLSILIECKTTRSDFLADKNKMFRKYPSKGMGRFRYYLCPPNVIKKEDLPEGWGLLYCYTTQIRKIIKSGRDGTYYTNSKAINELAEIQLMASALRRVEIRGDLQKIYSMEGVDHA